MGLFSGLFGSKEQKTSDPAAKAPTNGDEGVAVMMLYTSIPQFKEDALDKSIKSVFGTELSDIKLAVDKEAFFCRLQFGEDQITVAGLYAPYPKQVLDTILPVCHFAAVEKQKFHGSKAHVFISYKGKAAIHMQYHKIYAIVQSLYNEDKNAIGIVNESAMTAHPMSMLEAIEKERKELMQEKAMPFMSWMMWTGGCVKYILDANTIWYVTKGNHVFGLPEFAFKGSSAEGNSTMSLYNALFAYMYFYKAKIQAGHTAEIGGTQLKFSEVKEYRDMFVGKHGALVIEFN